MAIVGSAVHPCRPTLLEYRTHSGPIAAFVSGTAEDWTASSKG